MTGGDQVKRTQAFEDCRVAIVRRWRRYGLPHLACGYLVESDFACFGSATLTFGDGSSIEITDRQDVILTDVSWENIEE